MMNALDRGYIWTTVRLSMMKNNVKEFFRQQDGVSNVVATIIVLLITVLLIAVFWNQLQLWIDAIMDRIFGTEINDEGLTPVLGS